MLARLEGGRGRVVGGLCICDGSKTGLWDVRFCVVDMGPLVRNGRGLGGDWPGDRSRSRTEWTGSVFRGRDGLCTLAGLRLFRFVVPIRDHFLIWQVPSTRVRPGAVRCPLQLTSGAPSMCGAQTACDRRRRVLQDQHPRLVGSDQVVHAGCRPFLRFRPSASRWDARSDCPMREDRPSCSRIGNPAPRPQRLIRKRTGRVPRSLSTTVSS